MTTVSDSIRTAILECRETPYRIAQASGVAESTLSRFLSSGSTLSQRSIDRLAGYFGLELRRAHRSRGMAKGGR